MIEKHVKLEGVESADSAFSMTVGEFGRMVEDIRNATKIKNCSDYSLSPKEKESMVFRRSIFASEDIEAGEEFTEKNIRVIRPGYGIAPKHYKELLGKKSTRAIKRGEPLIPEDLG